MSYGTDTIVVSLSKESLVHRLSAGFFTVLAAFFFLLGPLPANALRKDAKLVTHAVALGLGGQLQNVENDEERIKLLKGFVHASRFDTNDSGYFYVVKRNGICIAHASMPELEGKDISSILDADGLNIFEESIRLINSDGGGFLEYKWSKPGAEGIFKKIGYVEPIPGTNYFLGSGVYFPSAW